MPKTTKTLAAAAIASMIATASMAGGMAGPAVEAEPFAVEEVGQAGSLGNGALLGGALLIALLIAANDSDSSTPEPDL